MRHATGLFRRGGSYYVRVILPPDHPLKARYRNGRYVVTLGQCSFPEANRRAALKRAELLYGFKPVAQATEPVRLRAVYERWCKAAVRSDDTAAAMARSLRLFETVLGDRDIQSITRQDGDTFRSWLTEQATTTKTARDRLNWIKSLLKYASQDLELITKNPWTGLEIKTKTTLTRRPWDREHLTLLFSHEIWQKGAIPTVKFAGGICAYWIPLLALYTGARLSEICQLEVKNIQEIDGLAVIKITDTGEGQSVKSNAGHRIIPIHSKLIELGFMNYVQSQSGSLLWQDLPRRDGKAGGFFSRFFGDLRKRLAIPADIVFHSFRHTFRSTLAERGISELIIDQLLGHETSGSVGAKAYTHLSLAKLKEAVEAFDDPLRSTNLAIYKHKTLPARPKSS
ncbi:MAG: tyrosine-type recombinase/integrase [Limnohabitans sp.]